VRSSKKGEIKS